MSEFAAFTEDTLQLRTLNPGVTVDYEMTADPADEKAVRENLEDATAQVLIAVDASLRTQQGGDLRKKADGIKQGLIDRGLIRRPGVSMPEAHHVTGGGLFALSAEMTKGLLEPAQDEYTRGGSGTPSGGYNLLGNIAVSRGYDYGSPLATVGVEGSHWFKKTVQMISNQPEQLTVGVFSSNQQHISAEWLDYELTNPVLAQYLEKQPTVRVSDTQPHTIAELRYDPYRVSKTVHGFRLPGFSDFAETAAREYDLQYMPPNSSRFSRFGVTAIAAFVDCQQSLGLQIHMHASQSFGPDSQEVAFQPGPENDEYIVADDQGRPVPLQSLSLKTQLIAPAKRGGWLPLRQDENIFSHNMRDQVVAFDHITRQLYNNLLHS